MHTSRDYRSRKSGLIGGEPSRGKSFLVLGPLMDLHGTGGNAVIELAPRPDWGQSQSGTGRPFSLRNSGLKSFDW